VTFPALIAALGFALTNGERAKMAYFEAVAVILPVLFLALLFQVRYFFQGTRIALPVWLERTWALVAITVFYPVLLMLYIGVGEFEALYALGRGGASSTGVGFTVGGLTGAFAALGLVALYDSLNEWPPWRRWLSLAPTAKATATTATTASGES